MKKCIELIPGDVYKQYVYLGKVRAGGRTFYARIIHSRLWYDLWLSKSNTFFPCVEIVTKKPFDFLNKKRKNLCCKLKKIKSKYRLENGNGQKFKFPPSEIEWL